MKAVAIQAFGRPEGLAVIDLPDPSPGPGQVLIATEAIGGGGVDVVIRNGTLAAYGFTEGHILGGEIAAGPGLPSFFARLNPNGRMVAVGIVAGPPPADFAMEMFAAFRKSMSFATFSTDTVPGPDRTAATARLLAAASRGELRAVVHEQLPLDQAVLAHQKMEAGEVFGRIVLTPSGS